MESAWNRIQYVQLSTMQVIKVKTSPNPQLLKGARKYRVKNKHPYLLNFKWNKLNNSRIALLCLIPITCPRVGEIQVRVSGSFLPENRVKAG